jgi:hypothetical protein
MTSSLKGAIRDMIPRLRGVLGKEGKYFFKGIGQMASGNDSIHRLKCSRHLMDQQLC